MSDTVQVIEQREDARYAALIAADEDALDDILHADFMIMHSGGTTDTKASYISALTTGSLDYKHVDRTEQIVKVEGGTALVFNRLAIGIVVGGAMKELDVRALSVWVLSGDAWSLLALQSGAVPANGR